MTFSLDNDRLLPSLRFWATLLTRPIIVPGHPFGIPLAARLGTELQGETCCLAPGVGNLLEGAIQGLGQPRPEAQGGAISCPNR